LGIACDAGGTPLGDTGWSAWPEGIYDADGARAQTPPLGCGACSLASVIAGDVSNPDELSAEQILAIKNFAFLKYLP
jgi:hypothetical protein